MALSLLAGPFTISVIVDGEVVPAAQNYYPAPQAWWPGVGLIATTPWYGLGAGILTLDGVFQGLMRSVSLGTFGWWVGANKMLQVGVDAHEYVLDSKTFLRLGMVPEDTVTGVVTGYVRVGGVRYIAQSNQVCSVIGGVVTPVGVVAGNKFPHVVGPGRNEHELFLSAEYGTCCFYDLTSNTATPWMYLGVSTPHMYYAPEFGVIVAYYDHYSQPAAILRVWSLEVKPFSVSVPELYRGENKGGRLATYRVQVTGDQGEACVGELIDWMHSGGGMLLQSQSTTDEEGYATTRVRYGLSDSGYTEVKASLTC